jgi:hypothetical protein
VIIEVAREAIYEHFLEAWEALYGDPPIIPVGLDNQTFTPPDDGAAYLTLTVRTQATAQETLAIEGRAKVRNYGSIFVQIFTPLDTGTHDRDVLIGQIKGILQRKTLHSGDPFNDTSEVRLEVCSAREIGKTGRWFMSMAETRFQFEEIS